MKLQKRIYEGELLPEWYGAAYANWTTAEYICYPIPLNWIAAWGVRLHQKIKRGPEQYLEDEKKEAYRRGFDKGRKASDAYAKMRETYPAGARSEQRDDLREAIGRLEAMIEDLRGNRK